MKKPEKGLLIHLKAFRLHTAVISNVATSIEKNVILLKIWLADNPFIDRAVITVF